MERQELGKNTCIIFSIISIINNLLMITKNLNNTIVIIFLITGLILNFLIVGYLIYLIFKTSLKSQVS